MGGEEKNKLSLHGNHAVLPCSPLMFLQGGDLRKESRKIGEMCFFPSTNIGGKGKIWVQHMNFPHFLGTHGFASSLLLPLWVYFLLWFLSVLSGVFCTFHMFLFDSVSEVALVVKNTPVSEGDIRDMGSVSGLERSPAGGHGNQLQYSCLENTVDREAWRAIVQRVAKNQTRLKWLSTST